MDGKSDDRVRDAGIYICEDGCERRYYQEGDTFLRCALQGGATRWRKMVEQ